MSPTSKREYFLSVQKRYRKGSRKERKVLLDELCVTCEYNRKYAIRKLKAYKPSRFRGVKEKRGRPRVYDDFDLQKPLKQIWLAANMPCSKRLKAVLSSWGLAYERRFGRLNAGVRERLQDISPSTIDRVLRPFRLKFRMKGRSTTKPGLLSKNNIPVKVHQWNERKPGFLEGDLVAHCGSSMSGRFVNTIDTVDIATGWTEQRAVFGRNPEDVLDKIKDIESSLPFELLGFDCDNGYEFINHPTAIYFLKRKKPVQFTRSRPYKKDDNAHVEQKNWTHVRQWLGYERFEQPILADRLNDLYKNELRLFQNFFLPSVKLLEKRRVGSKIIKIHDHPRTPFQRVVALPHYMSTKTKEDLKELFYHKLDPFELRERIDRKVHRIKKLANPTNRVIQFAGV